MIEIAKNLAHVQQTIRAAQQQYGRAPGSVRLLAVSKTQSVAIIQQAVDAGQYIFGENYLQEALTKIAAFKHKQLEWHFIGSIQSNKTKQLAENFDWIQSVDRLSIAERLSAQRPDYLPALNICIQVNLENEATKSGISLTELPELAWAINALPNLQLRGLMAIPMPHITFSAQRQAFHKLHAVFIELQQQGLHLDTLSMGMSHDFTAAIAEGSTLVRIGTAIFGAR